MAPGDIGRVVEIHVASFPGFFLSFLGPGFLREFYRGTLNDPASLALVAVDGPGRIAGFVAGHVEPSGFYRRLVMRRGWAFAMASIGPVLRRPAIIPRLFRATTYRGGTPATPGGALLASLAVHPERQALGAGKLLVCRFAEECFRRGATYIYLTTDRLHNDAVNQFYQSLGWKIETEVVTPEGRALNLYTYFKPADSVGQNCEGFSSVSNQSTVCAEEFIPFHRPSVGEEEIDAVTQVLRGGWLTMGKRTEEFEDAFARYIGCRYAIAVSSCTAALHLALDAAGVRRGEEVLVPTVTFAATAAVVVHMGAKPVLVDCEPHTFNLDPEKLEPCISTRTKAVIPVHLGGHPCRMDRILEMSKAKRLAVVEDAAHALPARYRGCRVGTLGDLTCFSFYATKTLTTGEGGMVTTDDREYADRIGIMRLHGIGKDAWKRYSAQGTWRYEILEAGYKYNPTDFQAALGLVQLARCDTMWQRRSEIARRYEEALSPVDAFSSLAQSDEVQNAWHLYVLLVRPSVLTIHRDTVIEELQKRGIGASVHFIPLHLHPYYQREWGYRRGRFPVAEDYFERCISLPIYPDMADHEVDRVIEGLRDIAAKFRR
jgi:dTDP-4-amino-4,6-dideoxygalactose transaminase/GNAT superfamily N-acetyltransferase